MKYVSTRGGEKRLSFEESLYRGYASDGGLLMPETIPNISIDTLKTWTKLTYPELLKEVVAIFVEEEDLPKKDLSNLIDKAMKGFDDPQITPIKKLKGSLNVMELFHGGTWAFKDIALSCVGQLLEYFLSKRKKHLTALVGTSGDTGSAAIHAVKGLKWVDIVVLLPKDRCTKVQELQMTTVIEKNVQVYRVDGSCDDLDEVIKKCFRDRLFCEEHNLCSINSVNWARILVQMGHFFYAYLKMYPMCDGILDIAIPTGALGHMTAGCLSNKMGLPIRLISTVNENDVVARTILNKELFTRSEVIRTLAPAMDIQIPVNIERIWYLFSEGNDQLISKMMQDFENSGHVSVPVNIDKEMKNVIKTAFVVSDELIKKTMRRCFDENSYYICPHTATALAYHYKSRQDADGENQLLCIATASVAKFQDAVEAADLPAQSCPEAIALKSLPTQFEDMKKGECWEEILRQKIVSITTNLQTEF